MKMGHFFDLWERYGFIGSALVTVITLIPASDPLSAGIPLWPVLWSSVAGGFLLIWLFGVIEWRIIQLIDITRKINDR